MTVTQIIKELKDSKGYGTSLVTYTIPFKSEIHQHISYLQTEFKTSVNIKDKKNSKSVQKSIKNIINKLKTMKKIPNTGIAFFSGASIQYI